MDIADRMRRLAEPCGTRPVVTILAVIVGTAAGGSLSAQGDPNFESAPYLRIDPQQTLITDSNGFTPCGECHTAEWDVWRTTLHATDFDTLHRTASAQDILQQMGLRVAKRQESLCMRCHYTVGPDSTAIAGVSCESCHGPARDWIDIHNRWGEGVTDRDQETPEHRQERITGSIAAGMLRPDEDIYAVAANCYECHTVPNEELVNRGGHSTGSVDFGLIQRIDAIRHNFVHRQWGDDSGNRELSPERKRVLFVVGRLLDYEFAIRGLAEAQVEGRYASSMSRRVQGAYRNLEDIASVMEIPEVLQVLSIGADLKLIPGNESQLSETAEQMRTVSQQFSSSADGAALAALDLLVEGGRPPRPAPAEGTMSGTAADQAQPNSGATAGTGPETAAPAEAALAATEPPELPGAIRSRPAWHNIDTEYSALGPDECVTCHGEAEEWWYDDPHSEAAYRLLGEDPAARQIAEIYGIGAGGVADTNQICLSCHGTVEEATGSLVAEGVSCESCHGPGSGYLEPHEDGGNPQLGMRALKQADVRAQNCSRCHLVTDERLLAAGHPSGADYDIAAANIQIQHWPGRRPDRGREDRGDPRYVPVPGADLQAAFARIEAARPIPAVTVVIPVAPAAPPSQPDSRGGAGGAGTSQSSGGVTPATVEPGGASQVSRPPVAPPSFSPRESDASVSLDLEPLPDDTDDLTTEELLLLVKARLDSVYSALGRGN